MKFTQANIDSIVTAQKNDNLTVFIGAGFSKFAETKTIKFPSWGELIEVLKNDLATKETDFLKIAQLYYLQFGEYKLYQKLREFVPLHATPSDLHVKLFQILKPKYVITTNWDDLLEKTITNNGLIYDVIKTEVDLIKSNLSRKLIKTHGDFDNHNIVFKEDDYLNYSINNPIFDNFLKHILSTTTVLFLGYSYSDNDLKQIIKWIEKNSKIVPPRLLLTKENNTSQNIYLENHGIKVLCPISNSEDLEYKKLYDDFFSILEDTIEGKIKSDDSEVSDGVIIDYFYANVIGLAELNSLLPEQITNVFSNCTIEYYHNCFGLHFHSDLITLDYDPEIRKAYSKFFEIINDIEKRKKYMDKINYIFSRFLSAGVVFIKNKDTPIDILTILGDKGQEIGENTKNNFYNFISFSSNMSRVLFEFLTYNNKSEDNCGNIHKTSNKNIELFENLLLDVVNNLIRRQYLSAMISKFNKSIIAKELANSSDVDEKLQNKFRKEQHNDFTNELINNNNYPNSYKRHLKSLVDLLGFKFIYKFYYESVIDNEKHLSLEESKKNGGFGFTDKEQRSNDRLIQLLKFCANNNIALDSYSEFQNLMKSYTIGKIKIHKVREKFKLTQVDLFILIKYFKFNELWDVLTKNVLVFVKEEPKEGNGSNIFFLSKEEKNYLKDTFDNLSKLFSEYGHYFYLNTVTRSFLNLIMLISLVRWNKDELNYFIDKIKSIFTNVIIPLDYINAINYFVLIQYELYKTNNPKFLELIDCVLEGFISGKFKVPFYQRINDDLQSIYHYSYINNTSYTNKKLVKKALSSIENDFDDPKMKRYFFQKFLLPVYQIANEEIKKLFLPHFDKLRISDWTKISKEYLYEEIFQELDFLQKGCEPKQEFINFMTKWVHNVLNKDALSDLDLLKKGGVDGLLEFIEFLVTKKNQSKLNELQILLKDKIENIKNS